MKEEKISIYRVLPICVMVLSAIISVGALCFINQLKFDQIICVSFLVISFIPIMVFELTYERMRNIMVNNQTNYKRVMFGFLICSALMFGISFLPEYFKPVILLPIIMSAFSNDIFGMISGFYFTILLTLITSANFYELLSYVMLVLIGGILSKMIKHMEYRLYIGMMYLFISVLFPNIFYYFEKEEISFQNLILGSLNGLVSAVYVIAFYPNIREKTKREKHYYYGDILSDEFAQIRKLKNASIDEYNHARKVSEIAYKYALRLELDADLAAAAGFYYHLGKWEGHPPIEKGVAKAKELCFPEELIQILREYNATDDFPSTPISALVHIVDGILLKKEQMDKGKEISQFDWEVLVHQTLNTFSSSGYYDQSSLSMNSFIKIREWLTKEEVLK